MQLKCALYGGIILIFFLSACTSQQMYSTGQAYAREQCLKIPDTKESQECLDQQNKSYDDYKRETQ